MMNYEEFKQSLLERLEENKPDNVLKFSLHTTRRTNEDSTDIITLMYSDVSNLSPIFYLKDMYAAYEQGMHEIDEYVRDIIDYVKKQQDQENYFDIADICRERAEECLKLRIYNREWNGNIERSCTHINMNDLMAVAIWETQFNGESGTITIDKGIQREILKMTDDELLSIASRNTMNEHYELKSMRESLLDCMEEYDETYMDELVPDDVMYVLSNKERCLGSTAILVKPVLRMAKEKLGENYFVLPSSIHETILVKESKVDSPEALRQMVKEVNATCVSQKEVLGENVYRFDGRRLQICNTTKEWKQQMDNEMSMSVDRTMQRRVGL